MLNPAVCILAAGKGTRMGEFAGVINKALLPLSEKAVITHIIEKFPEPTDFVIALGYLGSQVRDYLRLAHPRGRFTFVEVDRFEGEGSGPGHSLLCCEKFLRRPFVYVSCDTLWRNPIRPPEGDWIGIASIPEGQDPRRYCNVEVSEGRVAGIRDKEKVDPCRFRAFVGLCGVRRHEEFFRALREPGPAGLVGGERQISQGLAALLAEPGAAAVEVDWMDSGTAEDYAALCRESATFDFSKKSEFFYRVGGQVIKFFSDPSIVRDRVARARMNPRVFPAILGAGEQFYSYRFRPGETYYRSCARGAAGIGDFSAYLAWIKENLWLPRREHAAEVPKACGRFYRDKTLARLASYAEKYPGADRAMRVNGESLPPLGDLLARIPWEKLGQGIPVFIHGDLHFGNTVHDAEAREFTLIDWRQDFAGNLEFGDLYYDLAKLRGGLELNYELVQLGRFEYEEKPGGEIRMKAGREGFQDLYLECLDRFIVEQGWNLGKVRLITGLIYLNMSPLHHYPFDKLVYSLGRSVLARELGAP